MQRYVSTIRRKGTIIARAEAFGKDGSLEPVREAEAEIRRQLSVRNAASRSKPQRYRKKKAPHA